MKRTFLLISIVIFILVLAFTLFVNLFFNKKQNSSVNDSVLTTKDKSGIEVLSPKPNEIISSPLKITGYVNGGGWIGFEAEVGVVKLFDSRDNELGLAILTAKGEWMQVKIDFETKLEFKMPEDSQGKLVFYNENPSGEPERNRTFIIPIKFK